MKTTTGLAPTHLDRNDLDLLAIDAVVSDMDGVLWRGTEILPGVVEFFVRLAEFGVPFILATNNSGKEAEAYAARLREIGVADLTAAEVVTSGSVTAEVLSMRYPPGTVVHVLGSPALSAVLTRAGFAVMENEITDGVEVVVAGIDRKLTYDKLALATSYVLGGAAFYGTNADVSLPTASGLAPGAGSILAALEAATGVAPMVIGKPESHMFLSAVRRLGSAPDRTLMIGDRLDTDILGADRIGMRTALVLTGVENSESAGAAVTPADSVFADLPALTRAWARAKGQA